MSPTIQDEVLTLEEAAAYLRLPAETIARQAAQGNIPGRKIEDAWRFLKAAIDDWLRSPDILAIRFQHNGTWTDGESMVNEEERKRSNAALRQFIVSLGYPTGSGNEGIDAELAREYGDNHAMLSQVQR